MAESSGLNEHQSDNMDAILASLENLEDCLHDLASGAPTRVDLFCAAILGGLMPVVNVDGLGALVDNRARVDRITRDVFTLATAMALASRPYYADAAKETQPCASK